MSVKVRPAFEETRIGLTLAEPLLVTLTTPKRLAAAVRRRWWAVALALLAGAGSGIVAGRLLPPWYAANASFAVIPVDDPTSPAQDASGVALPLFSQVLVSRRVAEEVVDQLQLTQAYGKKAPQQAISELLSHVSVSTDRRANIVTLSVEDRVPAQAQKIAAALGEVARAVNTDIWSGRPGEHRKRLEARLAEVAKKLTAAEDAMREFREREHVVDLAEQVRASVAEAEFIERMKNERKIKLHFDQGFAGAESPEVRRSQLEAGGAQAVLQGLVKGGVARGPLLPLDNLPRLEQEHARLKREIDTNSSMYELLVRQVETLRAVEARPGGRAEIVDSPAQPQQPSRPSRFGLVMEGSFLGLLLGLLLTVWPRARFTEVHSTVPAVRADPQR